MSKQPTMMVMPKLWGVDGLLIFCVRKSGDVVTNSTRLIECTSPEEANRKGEAECNELMKDPTVVRVILSAVLSEGRRMEQ